MSSSEDDDLCKYCQIASEIALVLKRSREYYTEIYDKDDWDILSPLRIWINEHECACTNRCVFCDESLKIKDRLVCSSCDYVYCEECYNKEILENKKNEPRNNKICCDCQYLEP